MSQDVRDELVRRLVASEALLRRLQFSATLPESEYNLLDGLLDVTHQYRTSRPQVVGTIKSIKEVNRKDS